MRKVALLDPAGTVTLAGTRATGFVLVSGTTTPPAGALAVRVTLPVELLQPPANDPGVRVRADTAGSSTASSAVRVNPRREAETVTVFAEETGLVVTVKVAEDAPWATVTLAGTDATAGSELERFTGVPPAGAGRSRTTVPVEVFEPVTVVGASESPASSGVPARSSSRIVTVLPAYGPAWIEGEAITAKVTVSGSSVAKSSTGTALTN